ncbi:MAG TPA: hypothetical protein VKK61_08170, partial [Tepidisphaeraceae bacterium]|nr:hypothetical protein [Tepidisphaeraceae bacterium]
MKSLARFLMPAIVAVISSTCPATEPATQPDAGADLEHIAAKGMSISDAQCRELEIQVKQHPDDAEARAELLGYYLVLEYDSPTARVARREHAMWMIRNSSTDSFTGRGFCGFDPVIDPEGYAKARELWMQQLNDAHQPLTVLSNAANFFELHDPKEAETLLRRGMAADSKNPWWPEALAHL